MHVENTVDELRKKHREKLEVEYAEIQRRRSMRDVSVFCARQK